MADPMADVKPRRTAATGGRYAPPLSPAAIPIADVPDLPTNSAARIADTTLYVAGDLALLRRPRVAIVGARDVSDDGRRRATRLARELVARGVVVVSGLAKGVDAAAHTAAMANDGRTIAVIGTPLDRAYPAENAELQERIWREHLLVSQFAPGTRTYRTSFPERNKLMAAIAHATVIIEASDTSGTLHQAAECGRMGRPLFIARSVLEDPRVTWPARFLDKGKPVFVLESTQQILRALSPLV